MIERSKRQMKASTFARMLIAKFQCPDCKGNLREAPEAGLICTSCGGVIPVVDGIADFVRGRHDTVLDAEDYDTDHGINDTTSRQYYDQIRIAAHDRWPNSLGAVVEIGCGTGLYSRALLERGQPLEVVLTDVSMPMLRSCRSNLHRLGLLKGRPVGFASYSNHEACLRDSAFDTCIGTSALHHIPDVRGFLTDIHRALKPGGRAFFLEPNQRYYRALGHTLADVMVLLGARNPKWSEDQQRMLNLLAEWRREMLHQGDIAFLSQLEDKHFFLAEEFEDMAYGLGFDTAEALPFGSDPTGVDTLRSLCDQVGASEPFRDSAADLLLALGGRHFNLLSRRDATPTFLLWLTKEMVPQVRNSHKQPTISKPRPLADLSMEAVIGGLLPRWSFDLIAQPGADGVIVAISGWCLMNVDVAWVRITLNGVTRATPVWLPRADVHRILNQSGLYGAWNALCGGVSGELTFDSVQATDEGISLAVEIVLATGHVLSARSPSKLRLGQAIVVAA
jgi:SAM-dependent methyltransferase